MNKNEQGFAILISPGAAAPDANRGADILPALLKIAERESCSLLGYPPPPSPFTKEGGRKGRTVATFLFPAVANGKRTPNYWAFFQSKEHKNADPTKLPANIMSVDEVIECSQPSAR